MFSNFFPILSGLFSRLSPAQIPRQRRPNCLHGRGILPSQRQPAVRPHGRARGASSEAEEVGEELLGSGIYL